MKFLGKAGIRFYRKYISNLLPSRCRYTPTCSAYSYQAIKRYGLIIGGTMGLLRIIRCNPFSKGGLNPVKEFYNGKIKWLL